MSEIGVAYVQIRPTAQGISAEVEKELGSAGESGGKSFSNGFARVLKSGGKIAGGLVTLGGAVSTMVASGTKELAAYGDDIDKMSQKMGMSAEAYQEWDAVMQHSGTTMESMKTSMKTLATAAQTDSDAFEKLGLSQEEIANMSQEDLFAATITALQNVEDTTERTYLAGKVLGRGATELGALLNTSAEETQAMKDRVHELGGVLSDEAVKDAAAFQDQLQDMETAFQGISRQMLSDFLPGITTVMSGLTEIFSGNYEEGIAQISEGINDFVGKITAILPTVLEIGGQIIMNLASSILANLPQLLQIGFEVLFSLIRGIIDSLPTLIPMLVQVVTDIVLYLTSPDVIVQLVECALQLVIALAEGLLKAVPQLLLALPQIIESIVRTLIELAPGLLKAALELIITLGKGILDGWSQLKEYISNLWTNIKNAFSEKIAAVKQWGRDLIDNFIGGIKEKWQNFKDTISDLAQTVKDFLGFSEPEEGPLSNFHTFAPDMMRLFEQGIEENTPELEAQISKSFNFRPLIEGQSFGVADNATGEEQPVPVVVEIALQGDADTLFTAIQKKNQIYKKQNGESAFA